MKIAFRCVQNSTVKADVVDAKGSLVMERRMAARSDGSYIPVDEPRQEKSAERIYLFLESDEAQRRRDTANAIFLVITDPSQWGYFVEGQTYSIEF